MDIQILHIDDEIDIIEKVRKNIDGIVVSGQTLRIKDSCGFADGMEKLSTVQYDLVILDLCVGNASEESDKIGEEVFNQIQKRAFIPVIFFTGLPRYVESFRSDIVKVAGKAQGFDELISQIEQVLNSGFLKIRSDVDGMISEGVRSFFWNFVHAKSSIISQLKGDEISLKYLLLRRLGKSLSSDFLKSSIEEPQFKRELAHPMEFYVFPPLDGEYEAGDILQSKDAELYVTLTPSCDFVVRAKGNRNAEKILLVHARKFNSFLDFQRMKDLAEKHKQLMQANKDVPKEEAGQLKNIISQLKLMMKPGWNERYFFLPPTPFIEASMIDFQHKQMVTYDHLEKDFEPVASLDDPVAQAVLSSYARYQSRIGYPDLDIEYAFGKIH